MKCPLYKRYEKTKKDYMKELRNRKLRKIQEQALWRLVAEVVSETDESRKEFWIQRLTRNYWRMLYRMPKIDWIEYIGEFNDRQAWGHYRNAKYREYCLKIRDAAARMTGRVYYNREEQQIL